MGVLPHPPDLLDRLMAHRTLAGVPRAELEWLIPRGVLFQMELGNLLAQIPDVLLESMTIVLSGHFSIYVNHGAGPHKVMEWSGGDVTGLLPYSRMTKAIGEMTTEEAGQALVVHSRHFPEMIRECPVMTTRLVHVMIDRARVFRASELQDEKMLSLGRMSAGLAHELNNPASAAARSAKLLKESLEEGQKAAQALGAARLSDDQLALVERARRACVAAPASTLAPIERADREEAIVEWLEAHDADPAAAASLVDTGATLEGLDAMAAGLPDEVLPIALRWVAAGCTTRALATDIERASTRVHDLVGAIKRFAYMDRAQVPEPVDLVASLNDSVALMAHKARGKSIGIDIQADPNLPRVLAIGGDLNQVWTNLIDNAIDAAPEGGKIRLSVTCDHARATVHVVDNGLGIPADIRDRIFDPFITSKPVGKGTGLGLDVARQLVRRNNGDIEVDSEPGRTEFRVSLPIASGEAAPASH